MNKYPLWRYLLIVVLIVLGVIYALPNLYGEDPAIQITPKASVEITPQVAIKVANTLKKQNLPYKSIKKEGNTYLIRFNDTEVQLKAQDVIQAVIGNKYTVALNLAAKTPKWLDNIGAHPMKLGLDLRGGIHFLLRVDVQAMLKERFQSDSHEMSGQLRQNMIRYSGFTSSPEKGVQIRFRTSSARDKALSLLKTTYPNYTFTESRLGGNYVLSAKMSPEEITKLKQYAVTQNITTMRNRVNDLGVAEPVIQQQGSDQISVDLPGIQDTARAKSLIGKTATIRLQLVDTQHDAQQAASSGIVPFGDTLFRYQGRPYLLKNQIILHGSSILNASTITGEDGRPAVSIRAGGSDVANFNRITAANVNKPLATVYVETKTEKSLVNGKVVSRQVQTAKIINIANIQTALGASFQVQGLESMLYAKNLALLLRSGAYVAPVSITEERLVGPSLGKQNIKMGVLSTEIGSLLVILFMAFYYRLFGIIADLALILNVVFVVAIMSLIGATLTLPGIAGIVLTVGMAVDANVLINERIREELRNGVTPQAAINAGYGRAFMTIVDANVTTLIVAVVLFALGTGSVQGFAVTLSIGLLTSMVTSIFFTRAVVNLIYGKRRVSWLSIGIRNKNKLAKGDA